MPSVGPSRFGKSFRVAATVSAYRVVSFDTATTSDGYVRIIQIPTETSHILGIAQDYADTTSTQFQATPVASFGYGKITAGASVSAGAILTFATTTGYGIESGLGGTFATGTFSTVGSVVPKTIGIALQKASLSDATIECFIQLDNIRVRVA